MFKLEKFKVKDIIFIAIIGAAFTVCGAISIPFVIHVKIYGITFLVSSIFYSFFTVILAMKVKKPGCVFLAGVINGLVLAMMSLVMLFMQVLGSLIAELITLLIFKTYEKKWAVLCVGFLYMPIVYPFGILGTVLINYQGVIWKGTPVAEILCLAGVLILSAAGAAIGWKIGSELKKAGKLK